jgi:hypothetical protein
MNYKKLSLCIGYVGLVALNESGDILCEKCHYMPARHNLEQTYEFSNYSNNFWVSSTLSGTSSVIQGN